MLPVYQTKFSDEANGIHGNCFAACVASLLEIPPAEVPAFEDMHSGAWYGALWTLLHKHGCTSYGTRNLSCLSAWPREEEARVGPGVDGYHIVGGASPRGVKRGHCVIYYAGHMVHDPHPSAAGLADLQEIYLIERQPMEIPREYRAVRGNTYPVREELKSLGALWDRETGFWYVPPEKLREADEIVEEARVRRK